MVDVDDEHDIGQRLHDLDAAEAAFKLVTLTRKAKNFLLGQAVERAVLRHLLKRYKAFN